MNILELRELLTESCLKTNIQRSQVIVDCGSALVLHGVITNTSDVDIDIPEKDFERLAEKYSTHEALLGPAIAIQHNVNFHIRTELKAYKSTVINGFHVQRLPYVRQTYLQLLRLPHLSEGDEKRFRQRIRLVDHAISCPIRKSWFVK